MCWAPVSRHHFSFTTTCFEDMRTERREALPSPSRRAPAVTTRPARPCAARKARRPATFPLHGPRSPPVAAAWTLQAPVWPAHSPPDWPLCSTGSLRPRLLSGFFDHAPEGSSGARANPRCCCQGCTAGGKAWPGWMDGQQRARTEQLGVPGYPGGHRLLDTPSPVPPILSAPWDHLPAEAGQHPTSGLIPFRFWLVPSA